MFPVSSTATATAAVAKWKLVPHHDRQATHDTGPPASAASRISKIKHIPEGGSPPRTTIKVPSSCRDLAWALPAFKFTYDFKRAPVEGELSVAATERRTGVAWRLGARALGRERAG
eukprot:scaffold186654_cov31-Tisochrysis_lutea.AAC.1